MNVLNTNLQILERTFQIKMIYNALLIIDIKVGTSVCIPVLEVSCFCLKNVFLTKQALYEVSFCRIQLRY